MEDINSFKMHKHYPINFIKLFHGEEDFEIRLISDEKGSTNYPKSIFRIGDRYYERNKSAKRMDCYAVDEHMLEFYLTRANSEGYGIFFIPNTPTLEKDEDGLIQSLKDCHITKIN